MTRTAITLLRREFWEHPALYFGPVIVLALFLIAALSDFNHIGIWVEQIGDATARDTLGVALAAIGMPFVLVLLIVVPLYLLDSLYAERKDRSILFWKSMPVSDTATVLSKLAVAMLAVPLATWVILLATQLLLLAIAGIALAMSNAAPVTLLLQPLAFMQAQALVLYALLAVSLWYAPVYGWLLLVSAWSKRAAFLWATLTPIVAIVLEKKLLRSDYLAGWVGERLFGVFHLGFVLPPWSRNTYTDADTLQQSPAATELINASALVMSAELWIGLLVAAAFVAAAVGLRRYRDDS